MAFQDYFTIWDKLTADQQRWVSDSIQHRTIKKGTVVHNGSTADQQRWVSDSIQHRTIKKGTVVHNGSLDCAGLLLIESGQLRAYMLSDEGREITLYRLFDMDICLFSASCIMRSVQFEIIIQAEKDTQLWVIPPQVYKKLMEESAPVANYTNELMASRSASGVQEADGGVRSCGQLYQRADGKPVLRGDVAGGADHVEEPGQAPGRLPAGRICH